MKKIAGTLLFILLTIWSVAVPSQNAASACPLVVTNINDSGAGSLRQAILDANGMCNDITFHPTLITYPATITLSSQLTIDKSLTITGPGADQLSMSGADTVRNFFINSGTVQITGLTIRDGYADFGGGVRNYADLTLELVIETAIVRSCERSPQFTFMKTPEPIASA